MLKTVLKRLAGSGEGLADAGCCSLLLAALAWSPLYLASFGSCLFFLLLWLSHGGHSRAVLVQIVSLPQRVTL